MDRTALIECGRGQIIGGESNQSTEQVTLNSNGDGDHDDGHKYLGK